MTRMKLSKFLLVFIVLGVTIVVAGCGKTDASGASATTTVAQSPVVRSLDVIESPIKVADTALGPVGYRELGSGSPLLLIMGVGGSMDAWQPSFLATLATDHTVVVFDNAGVGETASLGTPLTVTEMANQTSAFISTLRLGRVAVLGWSMGGMVAQALAVLHPAQVSKLVLAATQPGTGHALPIPTAAAAAAASSNPANIISVLFPPGDIAAAQAYVTGIIRYPHFYLAPRTAISNQEVAVQQWMAGQDRAGSQLGRLRLPTLVADGTLDQLNPSANDRSLASSIPGAQLLLYSGAGHAFLFQDSASFLPAIERLLH
jgi:pimeloyl-ACP methyl ester carboxylesterase